jgi:cytochrome c5
MSDEHSSLIKTPKQLIIVVVASFLVPIILITMIVHIVTSSSAHIDKNDPRMSNEAVAQRLQPVGQVVVIDPNAPRVEKTGEQVYNGVCMACHASGALGAPKVGDKAGWAKRIAKGLDGLTKTAIKGVGQMPARGGSPELSDTEVKRAIAYMANKSGASFKEPEVKAAAPAAKPQAVPQPTATPAVSPAPAPIAATNTNKVEPVNKGKAVFDATCAACHATGVAGAPKAGDKAAWAPRIKTGMATLYSSALKGKNAMPPKGGRMDLPDADIKAAVDYLVGLAK